MADGLFGAGGLMGPMAPGMSAFVNPLTIMGAGLMQGTPLSALQTMGDLQTAGMQLAQQQAYQQEVMQRERDKMKMQKAQNAMAMQEQMRERRGLDALANFYAPNATAIGVDLTAEQQAQRDAFRQAFTDVPGFAEKVMSGEIAMPYQTGAGGRKPVGAILSREQILKEYNLADHTPESVAAVLRTGDTGLFVKKPKEYGFQEASTLRNEARKGIEDVSRAINKVRELSATIEEKTGIGDIASVRNFMIALEPGSVVQPSEAHLVSAAGGIIEDIKNLVEKTGGGGFLGNQREQMRSLFRRLMGVYADQERANREYYVELTKQFPGIEPEMVLPAPLPIGAAMSELRGGEVGGGMTVPSSVEVTDEEGRAFDEVLKGRLPQLPSFPQF